MRRKSKLGYAAAVFAMLTVMLFIGWWQVDGPGSPEPSQQRSIFLPAMDFSLTDHEGNKVDPGTLNGRPTMVFFGFTYCPDVCPTILSDISGWLDEMGQDAEQLNVVFITVDPKRDTREAMAEYVSNFHPLIRGWTGSEEQIAHAAWGFNATYEKVETEGGDYSINHTASVFVFNAKGHLASTIDYHEPREVAVPKIRRAMGI